MVLRLSTDNMQGLTPQQTEAVTGKIAENLKSWGYPVSADGNPPPAATHLLEAWVSKSARTALPPGFSLTFGSEDQRAPDRQKVDTVKVGCALSPVGGKAGRISLSGEFTAPDAGKSIFTGLSNQGTEHFYVDRMGSVCLNLLAELKVAKEKPKETPSGSAVSVPAWMPDMRIEIKTRGGKSKPGVSAPAAQPSTAAPAKPPDISAPSTTNPAPPPAQPPAQQPAAVDKTEIQPVSQPAESESGITTEERVDEADQRKQLIIHNQGNPIILEFGYDENRGMKW